MENKVSGLRNVGSAVLLAIALSNVLTPDAMAQATTRPCGAGEERPGPACLLARQRLGQLPGTQVYWHLHTYPDIAAAQRDMPPGGVAVTAFGQAWLFTVGDGSPPALHGTHVADVGPIPVEAGVAYDAQFLKSMFSPGMTAPVHVHSGPEAFYAVRGDTCLETPDGVQTGQGPGNSLVVRAGPPMLLMAPGPAPREGFALILHNHALPPTTLVDHWAPKGLCRAATAR